MIIEVRLPEISENVTSGEVLDIPVKPGDAVEKEQTLIELETEKAAVQVPSPGKGTVKEIPVNKGDTVHVGDVIARLETGESGDSSPPAAGKKGAGKAPEASAEKRKEREEPGRVEEASAETGMKKRPAGIQEIEPKRDLEPAPASPTVRRLARELGVDIRRVSGSGPGGRISADDVKDYVKSGSAGKAEESAVPLPDFSRWGPVRREKMSKVRQITARSMAYAWRTVPHVTQFDESDITNLAAFLTSRKKIAEKAGGKLTVTAAAVKVLASLVRKYPEFNSSIDPEKGEIVFKEYVNVGIAVATDRGLLVPVIRDADKKGLIDLAVELADLAERTRTKKVTPDEMEGGTITVSNLGGFGGTGFSPVVYWPQAAILGLARAQERPAAVGGKIDIRLMLPLSLSYDHRIIDGADGARFLRALAEILSDPYALLL
ncbi:MAG: 2-oxo acid dehydrogenase subunit E2 [Spirochaetales bacterium]|nr:2-oxo acid dehydrogenase subunit E2 [Spirochaetales bacterium]